MVELLTGILFLIFSNSTPYIYSSISDFGFQIFFSWIFLSILICISLIDIDNLWIPQGLINFGFLSGFFVLISIDIFNKQLFESNLIFNGAVSSLMAYFIFESIRILAKYIFKKDAIGKGDSKLVAMLSLWLGPMGTLLSVGIAYIFAAIFCLLAIPVKLVKFKQAIPFAPFLSLGGLLIWFVGNEFIIERILRI